MLIWRKITDISIDMAEFSFGKSEFRVTIGELCFG